MSKILDILETCDIFERQTVKQKIKIFKIAFEAFETITETSKKRKFLRQCKSHKLAKQDLSSDLNGYPNITVPEV